MKLRKILFVVLLLVCASSVCAKKQYSYARERARQDSRFVKFEKFFDVTNVRTRTRPVYYMSDDAHSCVIAEDYSVYATPKVEKIFKNFSFRFDWLFRGKGIEKIGGWCLIEANTESFEESPIDEVKLYNKIKKSIYKNPSFAKWLLQESLRHREKFQKSYVARILYEERISDGSWGSPIDFVWEKVGISGKYVGTLQIGFESQYRGHPIKGGGVVGYSFVLGYKFMLSDNGDILVASPSMFGDKTFFDSVLPRSASIRQCKESEKTIPFDCYYSIISSEHCQKPLLKNEVPYRIPQYCDYLIIRHDGEFEYGPESGDK